MKTTKQVAGFLDRDDTELISTVVSDIQHHVESLNATGDSFYGYAVLPGDPRTMPNPASIQIAFNRESDIKAEHQSDPYYRFCVNEWLTWVREGFENTNTLLKSNLNTFQQIHTSTNDYQLDEAELAYYSKINHAILAALLQLRHVETFNKDTFLTIWYTDSDDQIIKESARFLNKPETYKLFAKLF